jgi:hypothetical protein
VLEFLIFMLSFVTDVFILTDEVILIRRVVRWENVWVDM